MSKKPQKEDPVWSILPSYDMFQSTFLGDASPPDYNDQDTLSSHSLRSSTTALPSSATVSTDFPSSAQSRFSANISTHSSDSSVIVADQSTHHWRETILDNINNLRNISANPLLDDIDISVHFTEAVGQLGVAPKLIDPLQFEYTQGDYLNGYVLLRNNLGRRIPFEMFYVLFEGRFTVKRPAPNGGSVKRTENIKTFLEMYDFAASWTPLQVSRLLAENNEHYEFQLDVDPIDNSAACINEKVIEPGILYKRFFTFKIPEHLLDTQCNDHNLSSHTLLPPSMGLSDEERAGWKHKCAPVSDFNFVDLLVSYGVMARFIGKASRFNVLDSELKVKLTDSLGDEYVIFKQTTTYLRLVMEQNADTDAERLMYNETTRVLYENLLGRIQEKIKKGHELQRAKRAGNDAFQQYLASADEHCVETELLQHKNRQLYTRHAGEKHRPSAKSQLYEICVPLVKPGLLRQPKFQGMFTVTSPRTEYVLNYLRPRRFGDDVSQKMDLWQMEVPLDISYVPGENCGKIPEVAAVQCELVVFTMQTEEHPFPIELSHDLLFKNKAEKLEGALTDTFLQIVQNPMRQYGKELADLANDVGGRNFQFEKSLQKDMAALANARTKENRLNLREAKIIEENGTVRDNEKRLKMPLDRVGGGYSKKLIVSFNALKAEKKSLRTGPLPKDYMSNAEFCLDPSFQTCFLVRMYYLRLLVHVSTGERVELKLPVTVRKMYS